MTDPTTPAARPLPAYVAGLVERAKHMMTDAEWLEERAHILAGLSHKGVAAAPEPAVYQIPDFIAASRQLVPDLTAALEAQARQIADLTAERDFLLTCGIVELAVRNPNVAEYVRHWEGRAEKAEAELREAREAADLADPIADCGCEVCRGERRAAQRILALIDRPADQMTVAHDYTPSMNPNDQGECIVCGGGPHTRIGPDPQPVAQAARPMSVGYDLSRGDDYTVVCITNPTEEVLSYLRDIEGAGHD